MPYNVKVIGLRKNFSSGHFYVYIPIATTEDKFFFTVGCGRGVPHGFAGVRPLGRSSVEY